MCDLGGILLTFSIYLIGPRNTTPWVWIGFGYQKSRVFPPGLWFPGTWTYHYSKDDKNQNHSDGENGFTAANMEDYYDYNNEAFQSGLKKMEE